MTSSFHFRSNGVRRPAALLVLSLLSFSGLGPAGAADQPAEELAFVRGTPERSEIYVAREDGTGVRRLTSNHASDFSPRWSPDGTQILFASNRDGDDELYVMRADGTGVRQLTRNRADDVAADWSPDGRWIAFTSDRASRSEHEVFLMRADGTGVRQVTRHGRNPAQDFSFSPSFSPDGKRIVFTSNRAAYENPELFVTTRAGKPVRRITRTTGSVDRLGDDTMPDWSPLGTSIVFVSNRNGRDSDLWVTRPDRTGQHVLRRVAGSDEWNPRFSSDGARIAFTRLPPVAAPSVWIATADGSGAHRITAGSEPDWRP